MEILQAEDAITWMEEANKKMQTERDYLTALDQAIGDGDHGINMARGFQEVMNKLENETYSNVADVMKDAAMTLMSKVGGASGPLYGTAFLKLSMTFKGKEVDYKLFVKGIEGALNGIKQRGKAEVGEKTLVDVWAEVASSLQNHDCFSSGTIAEAAKTAMEKTKDTMATKGRAAYLKERSIGHLDPGSVSSYYIFDALAEVISEGA